VNITKVAVLFTTVPTKFRLKFSEFPTIFYTFYKFLQKENTIEDASLLLGPWKEIGTRNWVPRPWEAAAPAKFRRAGYAPDRGTARGGPQAHQGAIGGRGWGRDVTGAGARRWPAAVAGGGGRGGSGYGEGRALGWQLATCGGATDPKEVAHARGVL
jgi:hypothetical protein